MSDVWKTLRNRNERFEGRRRTERNFFIISTLYVLPAIPAIFTSEFIDVSFIDKLNEVPLLGWLAGMLGSALFGYAIVFAYMFLIWFGSVSFYRKYDWLTKLIVAWLAWAWFYYESWYKNDLEMAFLVALVISLFMGGILGFLFLCYEKIREHMFLDGSDET